MKSYNRERQIMLKSGFLKFEIDQFIDAKDRSGKPQDFTATFQSEAFQSMLKYRMKWVLDVQRIGWKGDQIKQALINYYKLSKVTTPFDFIRAEYGKMLKSRQRINRVLFRRTGLKYKTIKK
jgi:hypothetical protein